MKFSFRWKFFKMPNCLTVLLFTQILILTIAPLLFISVNILCEFDMLSHVYILLSLQEEEVHSSSWGNRCTHLAAHLSKRLSPWPVWLNGWVFVCKLSGCGFESCCCRLNFIYGACFEQGVPWNSDKLLSADSPWNLYVT